MRGRDVSLDGSYMGWNHSWGCAVMKAAPTLEGGWCGTGESVSGMAPETDFHMQQETLQRENLDYAASQLLSNTSNTFSQLH